MSNVLGRLSIFSLIVALSVGLSFKTLIKNQVSALTPPPLTPNPVSPIPNLFPCYTDGDTVHVYPNRVSLGCADLKTALQDAANQSREKYEIVVHPGVYFLDTDEFVASSSSAFAVPIATTNNFILRGSKDAAGKNLATIRVSGTKGFLEIQSTNAVISSLNFEGSTINGLMYVVEGADFQLLDANIDYAGSNVITVQDANSATFFGNTISGGLGAITASNVAYFKASYNTISHNSRGIVVDNSPAKIDYNLFVDNYEDGHSLSLTNPHSSYIGNNTIVHSFPSSYDFPLRIAGAQIDHSITLIKNIILSTGKGLLIQDSPQEALHIQENNIRTIQQNYEGIPDLTGVSGNISADPHFGDQYCLMPNSASLLPDGTYMGHTGPCEQALPTPDDEELVSFIHINPGQLTTTINTDRILFSAQAMKFDQGDIENATYEWGMSSDNSIGTLFSDESNQKQAWFTPTRAGRGDIWVTVRIGDYYKTASVPVVVSKLCQERDSCSTDACIQLVPSGGWCASEVLPGDVDFNNTVNHEDIIQFKQVFDKKFYPADFNFDGRVNIYDFLYIIKNFGLSVESIDGTSE